MDIVRSGQFDPEFTSHLDLLIQIDQNRFAFCLFNPDTNTIEILHSKALVTGAGETADFQRLFGLLSQEDELFLPFRKVTISFCAAPFTLLPAGWMEEGLEQEYLKWSHTCKPDDYILSYEQKEFHLLSNLPALQPQRLLDLWPSARFSHSISALMEMSRHENKGCHMWIDVHDGYLLLVGSKEGAIQLVNRYAYESKEDFTYFLLLAANQIEFDREEGHLHISGLLTSDAPITEEIDKYFRHFSFVTLESILLKTEEVPAMPLYTFAPLLNLP